ncbi:MAG TPA: hypothetical protein VGP07_19365 [Polyangia bacterium]|jgi:hypothetical protein
MNGIGDGRRYRWGVLGTVLLALGAVPATGCSFFMTSGPPPKAQRTPGFTCTESPLLPAADIAVSVLSFAETIHAASRGRTPLPWLGASLVFGASAGVGGIRVNACNKAHGHPYVPHAPTAQPDMMPEMPFGMKGAHLEKPPQPGEDDDAVPELEPAEHTSPMATPPLQTPP